MYFQHAAALWRDFLSLVPGVLKPTQYRCAAESLPRRFRTPRPPC